MADQQQSIKEAREALFQELKELERQASLIGSRRSKMLAQLADEEAQIRHRVSALQKRLHELKGPAPLGTIFMRVAEERLGKDAYGMIYQEALRRREEQEARLPAPDGQQEGE